MSYIYSKQTVLEKMLEHVYDKSICDIIIKVLNISNNATSAHNNSVNNDSGDIFGSPGKHAHSKEEIGSSFVDYESNRNQIVHKLIDKLIRAKSHEEYWNSCTILCEMAKFSHMFEFLSSSEIMEKISIGLENEDEEGIKCTLRLYNTIIKEYSKDGTNKRVNISALQEDGEGEKEAETPILRVETADDGVKDRNANEDKSGDQSGSNLSKSANVKENIKEVQFINTICNIIPLVIQLIKDEQNQKFIDTTYQTQVKVFGGMRLEAVEFIRLIASKFCVNIKEDLIKCNIYEHLFTLFEKYPNNCMLHSKIEEIVSFSLKHGGIDIIEEIIYKAQLIKHILELSTTEKQSMTYKTTQNKCSYGFVPYIINIANELVKQAKTEAEISNTLESIPEWGKFQEGILKSKNDVLVAPLGGRDPRTKIDSLFDDNDFLGRFKGFKPVPFESIKNRRKNMKKNEIEMEQETEEEEEDDEDKLEMEDINQYYIDNDEVIELDLKDTPDHVFSKSSNTGESNKNYCSQRYSKDITVKSQNRGTSNRYSTIELDDEDDVEMIEDYYEDEQEDEREDDAEQKGLEWKIDPVSKESDNERLIDDNIVDVAMEFIRGKTKNRNHAKHHDILSKIKTFDPNDDLIMNSKQKLNKDLKELREFDNCGLPNIEDNSSSSENNSEENIELYKQETFDHVNPEINVDSAKENEVNTLICVANSEEKCKEDCKEEPINDDSLQKSEEPDDNLKNEIEENKEYYDTEYWRNPYTTGFRIDDLLREFH